MEKASSIKVEINRCKKIIEHQLGWAIDFVPTRREYEILVERIFDKTGVLLSLSTIRRIWSDDFKNIPHKSTLDAMAKFAGFVDWQNFTEIDTKGEFIPKKKNSFSKIIMGIIIILTVVVIILTYQYFQVKRVEISGPIVFEYYQESDSMVPNIVVFSYDVSNIHADSFFIVESSNDYLRKRLKVKIGQMTSSYYQPGSYEAFLLADDSIVGKLDIEILSNSWVAMLKYQLAPNDLPYYFYGNDIIFDGLLNVSRDMIVNNNIEISDDLYTVLTNTFNSDTFKMGNFNFETRIKLDSIETYLTCPKIYISLLFDELCYIPLVQYGGQDKLQIKYGNTYMTSNDSDLSGFGCNIYDWQKVEITSMDSRTEIILNNEIIATILDSTGMGKFKGFSLSFDGIGSMDYILLSSIVNDTIFYDDFSVAY